MDWSTRGLDKSRSEQLADATGDFACLVFVLLEASSETTSCPVRELAYPRVVQLPCGLSVSPSVTVVSPAKMAEPIDWDVASGEPKEPCIRWGPHCPVQSDNFYGK